jgi:hypothetical protein
MLPRDVLCTPSAACWVALFAVGCNHSQPASTDKFEYKATAGWYIGTTSNVTSMTIDGQPYASGETYAIDEMYATYDDALASFVPHNVVITTTTETLTFQIDIGACEMVPPGSFDMPITKETDQFFAVPSQHPPPSVEFFSDCGSCESKDKLVGYCARTQ